MDELEPLSCEWLKLIGFSVEEEEAVVAQVTPEAELGDDDLTDLGILDTDTDLAVDEMIQAWTTRPRWK